MEGAAGTMESMIEGEDIVSGVESAPEPEPRVAPEAAQPAAHVQQLQQPPAIEAHRIIEAILFTTDTPVPAAKLAAFLDVGDARDVRKHIDLLNEEYAQRGSAFRIENVAGGYQMLTLPAYNTWLRKLLRARQESRLSPAALETLAVVAYKQPCTRAEIESVRGVAAGDLLNRLREMNLIKIVGRAEDLGRPLLYGTTKHFLEVFGLPSLEDLPQVEALSGGGNSTSPKLSPPRQQPQAPIETAEAENDESPQVLSEGKAPLVNQDLSPPDRSQASPEED